jgi:hypothetical protein
MRREYKRTADIIKAARLANIVDDMGRDLLTAAFALEFDAHDARFPRAQFIAACGGNMQALVTASQKKQIDLFKRILAKSA